MWKDSEAEIDYLDYSYLVESINSIIMDDSLLPASIGLYGDWGSGKSTLINMSKSQLEEMNPNTKCLIFNGWLFESYDDTKTAILEEILDIFSHEQSLGEKAKKTLETLWEKVDKIKLGKFALKRGLNFINPATIGMDAFKKLFDILKQDSTLPTDKIFDIKGFREELSGKLNYADLRNDVRGFQKEFESLLKDSNIDRLVVYIDELDRCRPDTILETLEAIKLFLFTGKTAFIIGADQRHIEYAVRTKFKDIEGQEIDIGKEYLEKLIQYPIIIPRLDTSEAETYISCLLFQKRLPKEDFNMAIRKLQEDHDVDFEGSRFVSILDEMKLDYGDTLNVAHQLASLLGHRLNGNPRQFKRFLNMLELRLLQAKLKRKNLDRSVLVKIMIVEYYRPSLFNKMAYLAQENKLSQQLKEVESISRNEHVNEENIFSPYKDDSWLSQWINSKPLLSNIDLRLYFYFSRTATEERLNLLSASLSPMARQAVDKLTSAAETIIDSGIELTNELPRSDKEQVFTVFFSILGSQEKIESKHFKALLKIATISEQDSTLIKHLKQFSKSQMKISFMPLLAEYAISTGSKDAVIEIAQKNWGAKFVQALTKSFDGV